MSVFATLLMTATISGCTPETDAQSVFHAIEKANATAVASLKVGDVVTYSGLFTEDAWSMPPNSPVSKGRAEILNAFKNMTTLGKVEFNLKAVDVFVCGASAVERGEFTLDFTPYEETSLIPAFHDEGNYLAHWVEEDGKWLIRSDAPVSTLPIPQPE